MAATNTFRELCAEHGIAVTHQRQVLWEVMRGMDGHPSPEEIYARVKRKIPAVSLATVYKNIHLFVESGVLRELSLHHGSQRVELNEGEHYHLVCTECKRVTDIAAGQLNLPPVPQSLPGGFRAERYAVDVIGICSTCSAHS